MSIGPYQDLAEMHLVLSGHGKEEIRQRKRDKTGEGKSKM